MARCLADTTGIARGVPSVAECQVSWGAHNGAIGTAVPRIICAHGAASSPTPRPRRLLFGLQVVKPLKLSHTPPPSMVMPTSRPLRRISLRSQPGPSDYEMNDIAAKIALLGHLVEQLGHRVDVLEDNLRARMDALEARCSGIEGSLEQWSWQ